MAGELLFESNSIDEKEKDKKKPAIVSGVVINNCDLIKQGKVLVRIPSLGEEVWARVLSTAAGSKRGIMDIPQPDDEVVVSFAHDNPGDAFILGSLWNNKDDMPVDSPDELLFKRVIQTGVGKLTGHRIELDDARQSMIITSSTKQKVEILPEKIEISTTKGTAKITLDTTGNITIEAALSLTLKARQIKLDGTQVEIAGQVKTDVKSNGECSINAPLVRIN